MDKFALFVHRWCQVRKSKYGRHKKGWKKQRLQKWNEVRHLASQLNISLKEVHHE